MILSVGFLLLVSLVFIAALAILENYLGSLVPGIQFFLSALNLFLSFGTITLLFALIYKFLPDVKITWGDVGIGSAITALLFTIGKSLIGLYLGNSSVGSTYGAVGSFVVVLLWVNYSAQILLFGAEFTQVYANRYGSQIVPASHAVPLTENARVQQGIPRLEDLQTPDPAELQRNHRSKRHPVAVILTGLIEVYQGIVHLARATGRKNRRK